MSCVNAKEFNIRSNWIKMCISSFFCVTWTSYFFHKTLHRCFYSQKSSDVLIVSRNHQTIITFTKCWIRLLTRKRDEYFLHICYDQLWCLKQYFVLDSVWRSFSFKCGHMWIQPGSCVFVCAFPMKGKEFCFGVNNEQYRCEMGYCCGETECCTYYYELWCKLALHSWSIWPVYSTNVWMT